MWTIFVIGFIIYLLFSYLMNPLGRFYETYGGKKWTEKGLKTEKGTKYVVALLGLLAFYIIDLCIVMSFMFAFGKKIIYAKYYAIFLLSMTALMLLFHKEKNKELPKKRPFFSRIYQWITTLIEVGFAIWYLL